jgi:hypothetical protein
MSTFNDLATPCRPAFATTYEYSAQQVPPHQTHAPTVISLLCIRPFSLPATFPTCSPDFPCAQQYNPYEAYNQAGQFTYQWQQPAAGKHPKPQIEPPKTLPRAQLHRRTAPALHAFPALRGWRRAPARRPVASRRTGRARPGPPYPPRLRAGALHRRWPPPPLATHE